MTVRDLNLLERLAQLLGAYVASVPVQEASELPADVRAALACFAELRRMRNAALRRAAS